MKAISLWQPWATLIAIGQKRIETRSWQTSYRGLLAIHATKAFPRDAQELCYHDPFFSVLKNGPGNLPRGAIVAVATLTGIGKTEDIVSWSQGLLRHEIEFGDYSRGRFGWVLQDVVRLDTPVPCRGRQQLFDLTADVEAAVRNQHGVEVAR